MKNPITFYNWLEPIVKGWTYVYEGLELLIETNVIISIV